MKSLNDSRAVLVLGKMVSSMQLLHLETQALALTVGSMIVEDGEHIENYETLVREMNKAQSQIDEMTQEFLGWMEEADQ